MADKLARIMVLALVCLFLPAEEKCSGDPSHSVEIVPGCNYAGDLNHDCRVDFIDHVLLAAQWSMSDCAPGNQWCSGADFDLDGLVDFRDTTILAEHWLAAENLATKYAELCDNTSMGTLSATNRRALVLTPGTYAMSYTVLMDTDYVDILPMIDGEATITKSGNSMGLVLMPGVDAVALRATDDRVYKGSYSRPGEAYDEFDMYAMNQAPVASMPVMGFVTGATELANEVSGATMSVQYTGGGVLFGKSARYGERDKIYKSTDGTTWVSAGDDAPAEISQMWAADPNGNCVMATTELPPSVYYGTYSAGTLTFTRATNVTAIDPVPFSVISSAVDSFNFIKLANGTLLLSEYGSWGRCIYRSTDLGHTWKLVYAPYFGVVNHWHGFGQLLSTGRVVASSGDGTRARTIYSDDNGITWATLHAAGTSIFQPITYMDIGHSSKLLAADDSSEGLLLLDVYSGEITPIFSDQDRRNYRGLMWSLARNGSTIYAGSFDTSADAAGTSPVILATEDLVNWSSVYRVASATPYGVGRLLWFNGALHGLVGCYGATPTVHLKITPPVVTHKRYGVKVEQAVTNRLTTPGKSSLEDESFGTYVNSNGTVTQVEASAVRKIPHGTKAVRITREASSSSSYITRSNGSSYGIAVSTGEKYSGSVMLGVPSDGVATLFNVRWVRGGGASATNATEANGYFLYAIVQPGDWVTVVLPPITVDAGDNGILGMCVDSRLLTGTHTDFLIDEVQICGNGDQPSSWQLGGTPRSSAVYDLNWNAPEKATHIFSFCPFEKSEWYDILGGNWYIRSWRVSETVHAQLYYDADDRKIKLDLDDGVNTDSLSTAALLFKKGQPLIFVVQFGDDNDAKAHLSVGHGREIETVDGLDDFTAFGSADILVRWGDKDAANGLNGRLYDLDMTGVLAPGDIVEHVSSLISE